MVNCIFSWKFLLSPLVAVQIHHRLPAFPRKPRSFVWHFCSKINPGIAGCNVCGAHIPTPNGSTTGVKFHLKKKHDIQDFPKQWSLTRLEEDEQFNSSLKFISLIFTEFLSCKKKGGQIWDFSLLICFLFCCSSHPQQSASQGGFLCMELLFEGRQQRFCLL